ncbi:MAG: rhomboid family intramembrane serine protease [Solirubrobacteraceae bacterium]
MSAGGPDLFVICKSCGSEVSPYITECPYCGNRLRKRAPKLDRDQRVAEPKQRRGAPPLLTRLRADEIPGIRGDSRPLATGALVLAGLAGALLWQTSVSQYLFLLGKPGSGAPGSQWWRIFTAAFAYDNVGYAFVVLAAIALFGWLLERRHGSTVVLVLFLLGGVGGIAATGEVLTTAYQTGAVGAAIALLVAWAIPDLFTLLRRGEIEGDLIGAAAIALTVAAMPLAVPDASWVALGVGAAAGIVVGLPLAALRAR